MTMNGTLQFQYGNPDRLCSPLIEAKKAGEDLVVSPCSFQIYDKLQES